MKECSAYVVLDVHKETIAVAVVLLGRDQEPAQIDTEADQPVVRG
jgi:hypothetical protein